MAYDAAHPGNDVSKPLSSAEAKYQADKTKVAVAHLAAKLAAVNTIRPASCPVGESCGNSRSGALPASQEPQIYGNYCGPASVRASLQQRGVSVSQQTLAARFGISPNNGGTNWGTGRDAPVASAMNAYAGLPNFHWSGSAVSYTATATDIADYKARLAADIDWGMPLVGDVWEVKGQSNPHLAGHPTTFDIFHWVNIRAYSDYGAVTGYQDSVHGSTISWAGPVPAYATIDSGIMTRLTGGRGYVW